jgi:hypothetical protein
MKKIIPFVLLLQLLAFNSYAQNKTQSTEPAKALAQNRHEETAFIYHIINDVYADPDRCSTRAQRDSIFQYIDSQITSAHNLKYVLSWRYFSRMIEDGHFQFPDIGVYNRNKWFKPEDLVFPIFPKITQDGRIFVITDYTGNLPKHSEITSINGIPAQTLAKKQVEVTYCAPLYARAWMNSQIEGDPRAWNNITGYLFCESVKPPYSIEYKVYSDTTFTSSETKTATLQGIGREERYKLYKQNGDVKIKRHENAFNLHNQSLSYYKLNDSTGVLDINLFYSKEFTAIFFMKNDNAYKDRIEECMKQVHQDGVTNLIVDIRNNPGGYAGDVFETLNYFLDSSLPIKEFFRASSYSKKDGLPLLKNTYEMYYNSEGLSKKEKDSINNLINKSVEIFKNTPDGKYFRLDTLLKTEYVHSETKYPFKGKLYVATNNLSFSACMLFCNLLKAAGRATFIGETPGEYLLTTGGPRVFIQLPYNSYITMQVPYTYVAVTDKNGNILNIGHQNLKIDMPIEPTLYEWLKGDEDYLYRDFLNRNK